MVDTHGACTVHNETVPPPLFADGGSLAEADFDSFRSLCATDNLEYQQRLARQPSIAPPAGRRLVGVGTYSQRLECLKPKDSWKLRHEPLRQKLVPGRVCAHALCATDNCALHVRDEMVLAAEAAELVEHGVQVLASEDEGSSFGGLAYSRSRRIDFLQSAADGSMAGHLLCLRVAERLRRIVSGAFRLPLAQVRLSEHFLTLRQPGPSLEQPVHCDEAVFPHGEGAHGRWRFHFSSVLWLGESGGDFDGGRLAFYNNSTRPWLEVEPMVGRAAVFSSGWENIHAIQRVTRGHRWAFTAAFMVQEETAARAEHGRHFYEQCVRPAPQGESYASCRQQWAAAMEPRTESEDGGHV